MKIEANQAFSSVKIQLQLVLTNTGRTLKCFILHDFKTEDIFAETEFNVQSHFSASMDMITRQYGSTQVKGRS